MSTIFPRDTNYLKLIFSYQWSMTSDDELMKHAGQSRKRTHPFERNARPQPENMHSTLEASDLVSLFHELALFDEQNEKINGKDIIRQECIDRIEKLYKPALMEGNAHQVCMNKRWNNIDVSKNTRHVDDYKCRTNENFEKDQWPSNENLLIENDADTHFREAVLKHCSDELLLPFSDFEDIVMGLAVSCFGEAFSFNESLCKSLCEYINEMSKKPVGNVQFDEGSEYDSDSCTGIFNTQKRKRRKIMSACLSFE
ncbi:uncharacterized protein LOC119073986 [Bradysia coprophila]|uniref:uncharacterized protein LOC119073986 n=1 Tax=Bradysia coprophila TaxID=38358 RepID=UPI00187D83DD|nr:uncharacterized protein LOC119073986 [Bradysia coprophila]